MREALPILEMRGDGDIAGFRFVDAVSIERLLADAPEGLSKRSVRLRLALPVTPSVAGRELARLTAALEPASAGQGGAALTAC